MTHPGVPQNAPLQSWLGGVVPTWVMLDSAAFSALRESPHPQNGPIRLATDLSPEETGRSAVCRNALVLLHAADTAQGLQLTATGNLSRKVVSDMLGLFSWPDQDISKVLHLNKVVNEPDFLPLFLVRHLAQVGGLVKPRKDRLKLTPAGRLSLQSPGRDALQALLFHVAFWLVDLSYLGRGLLGGWPQSHIGLVLWSLSVSANDWLSCERLTRLCTVPTADVIESKWDAGSHAMEATVLRPLMFFGLLEHHAKDIPGERFLKRHLYRKTPLFDRFLTFDVKLETGGALRH